MTSDPANNKPGKQNKPSVVLASDAPGRRASLQHQSGSIEPEVARRTQEAMQRAMQKATKELLAAQDVIILAITSLADAGNHIPRIQHYVRALALHLKNHPRFAPELTDQQIDLLFKFAPLHGIGKIGIPDRILLKPGQLTPQEFEIMKNHTTLGRDAIEQAEHALGQPLAILRVAKEMVMSHQEKWDGSGYPQGLAGDAIPLSARLMAVANVYDALISERIYKRAVPHDQAVGIIFQGRGSHFDPDLVDAFIEIQFEIQAIAQRFADTESAMQKKIEYMANAIAENP